MKTVTFFNVDDKTIYNKTERKRQREKFPYI